MMNTHSLFARFLIPSALFMLLAVAAHGQRGQSVPEKMKLIVLPELRMENALLSEAVAILRAKAKELDEAVPDPGKKGINIIVSAPEGDAALPRITLDLKKVPFEEALKAITDLAGCHYRVEHYFVAIVSPQGDQETFLRVFQTAPSFAPMGIPAARDKNGPPLDEAELPVRETAESILSKNGVVFPEGTRAYFNRSNSQLLVKNTRINLERVQSFLSKRHSRPIPIVNATVQIYALPLSEAQQILKDHTDANADVKPLARQMAQRARDGEITLAASQNLVTKIGGRATRQHGKSLDYISGYIEKDGKDEPVRETALVGTRLIIATTQGADESAINMDVSISQGIGDLSMEQKKTIAPASGQEVVVQSANLVQRTLKKAVTLQNGSTSLLGMTLGPKDKPAEARLVFLTVWLSDGVGIPIGKSRFFSPDLGNNKSL